MGREGPPAPWWFVTLLAWPALWAWSRRAAESDKALEEAKREVTRLRAELEKKRVACAEAEDALDEHRKGAAALKSSCEAETRRSVTDVDAVKRQAAAQADAYMKLMEENMSL